MEIEFKLNCNVDDKWNDLIFIKKQHTIFLSQKFLSYHPNTRFDNFNICIFVDNELFLIIPAVKKNNELFSHSGTTYGGILQFFVLSKNDYEKVYSNLKKFLVENDIQNITLRLPPRVFTENTEYSFLDSISDQEFLFEEEETYVPIEGLDLFDLNKSGFRRNHIRDIKKIIEIEDQFIIRRANSEDDLDNYYKILIANLEKHNVNPTHTKEELRILMKLFDDDIWIDVLTYQEKIVAGLMCLKMNSEILHYFYGSIDYNFEYKGIIKYIYWKSMIKAQDYNFKKVNFGVDSKYGEVPNESLRLFKSGFGGIHTFRKTIRLKW